MNQKQRSGQIHFKLEKKWSPAFYRRAEAGVKKEISGKEKLKE